MPKVTIDNHTIEVPEGTTILNAARMIGGEIVGGCDMTSGVIIAIIYGPKRKCEDHL